MTRKIVVAALYKFVSLPDYVALRDPLLATLTENGIKGTLLLAEEGINGTVSGTREAIDALLDWFRRDPRLADIDHKKSYCDEQPFYRTKVKLKKEIVTLGVPGVDPNQRVGTYVEPRDWNALIEDPEVLLIDTRNDYEVAIGTFEGAIDPQTKSFREFPDYIKAHYDPAKHKKVAMFCTRWHSLRKGLELHARRRGSKRSITSRAAFSNTWKRYPRPSRAGRATASCSTTGSPFATTSVPVSSTCAMPVAPRCPWKTGNRSTTLRVSAARIAGTL